VEVEIVMYVTDQAGMIVYIVQMDLTTMEAHVHSAMVKEIIPAHSVMGQGILIKPDTVRIKLFILGLLQLFTGTIIYILFRDTNEILVFQLLDISYGETFLSEYVPNFVKYQLPDMLWASSFLMFTKSIDRSKYFVLILFFWLILLETSQIYISWGTFDILDVISICIPFLVDYFSSLIISCQRIHPKGFL